MEKKTSDCPAPSLRSRVRRRVISLLITLSVCYVVWMCAALLIQDRIIFPGAWLLNAGARPAQASGAVVLTRDIGHDRIVQAIFVPPSPSDQGPAPLVVMFHGNGELGDDYLPEAQALAMEGFAVLLPEYRGYGRSQGKPGRTGITEDAVYFVDQVAADPRVDAARTVYIGRSLGGAVAADVARTRPPAAMVLESTLTDMASMFRRVLLPPFVVRHRYNTRTVLRDFGGPVMIVHGTGDGVIHAGHGRKLARLRPDAKFFQPDCGHYPSVTWPEYDSTLREFLADSGLMPQARTSPAEESAE